MRKYEEEPANGLPEIGVGLDELVRRGARQVIQQAIEAELAQLLERKRGTSNVLTLLLVFARRMLRGYRYQSDTLASLSATLHGNNSPIRFTG